MTTQRLLNIAVLFYLLPNLALAHSGHHVASSFIHGFSHPFSGADHLLAMIVVGLWAAQLGGRALWLVPSIFVMTMVIGATLAFSGFSLLFIEQGVAVSVFILGILVAGAYKLPLFFSAAIVGFFALFHGYAHSSEIPALAGVTLYSAGFALATALLHTLGILSAIFFAKINFAKLNRFAGGAIALSGLYLVLL